MTCLCICWDLELHKKDAAFQHSCNMLTDHKLFLLSLSGFVEDALEKTNCASAAPEREENEAESKDNDNDF